MPASHVPSRNAPLQWALRRTRDRSFELRCLREDLLAGPDLHQRRVRHRNRMPARADDLREQLRQHEDRPEQLRDLWDALSVRRVLERLVRCGAGHLHRQVGGRRLRGGELLGGVHVQWHGRRLHRHVLSWFR